jgi:hypothetical protein
VNLLGKVKYVAGTLWDETTFTAKWVWGTPEQKEYCTAIDTLAQKVGLDRLTIQKWFDGAVNDSGLPWKQVYGITIVELFAQKPLHEIYQVIIRQPT